MSHQEQDSVSALQAILFVYGEPMPEKKLAKILGLTEEKLREVAGALAAKLKEGGGLALISLDNSMQLATKPEYGKLIETIIKEELNEDLSPASLETLAIVLYMGPVYRVKIDYIRGVNSTFILRSLLLRGLVDREPDPARANAYLYKASFNFIRHLGLQKTDDLPEFAKYKELLNKLQPAPAE